MEKVEVTSEAALWAWLAAEHSRADGVWLVTWKAAHPVKYVSREAVLDALVAHGWVDGRRKVLDADRTMQLITPRKTQAWAKSYKDRAARLTREGRMAAPGLAAVAAGKASGLWAYWDDVDALIVPDDLATALGPLGDRFAALAPSYRRNVLRWIKLAKTAPTRAKRVASAVAHTDAGTKIPQL